MNEIWKYIKYHNKYQVSNYGRIKSFKQDSSGVVLKPIFHKSNGYSSINLDGKRFYIHRIVADHFIDNLENKKEINHINFNRSDNKASNLEHVNKNENSKHSKSRMARGEKHHFSKFNNEQIRSIRSLKLSIRKLSCLYNVCVRTIHQIKKRITWSHIPD